MFHRKKSKYNKQTQKAPIKQDFIVKNAIWLWAELGKIGVLSKVRNEGFR